MITLADMDVLKKARAFYGRTWRKDIQDAWFNGDYKGLDTNTASALQRIRNKERDWSLHKVKLGA